VFTARYGLRLYVSYVSVLIFSFKTGPCLRQSVACVSGRIPEFDPGSVRARHVVDRVALGAGFLGVGKLYPEVSYYQRSTLIFIYMLILPEGHTIETWGTCKKRTSFGHRGGIWQNNDNGCCSFGATSLQLVSPMCG
jgi:hypothetical protein